MTNDTPQTLEELDRLRADNERLRGEVKRLRRELQYIESMCGPKMAPSTEKARRLHTIAHHVANVLTVNHDIGNEKE